MYYDYSYKNGIIIMSIFNFKVLSVRVSLVGDVLFLDIFRKEEE